MRAPRTRDAPRNQSIKTAKPDFQVVSLLYTGIFRWYLCYIRVPRYVAHKGRGVGMAGW